MEEIIDNQYGNEVNIAPERPEFLKILCILSFVACGLMILFCSLGSVCLALDAATIEEVWGKVVESSPQLAEVDPVLFMHEIGMVCVYTLIANIFSLIGVIMMWRLEKFGFFIYAAAELATHFFRLEMPGAEERSAAGVIFSVGIDVIFIVLYFVNLKHMNKKNSTFIQPGT